MTIFAYYQYINHAYVVGGSEKVPRPAYVIYEYSLTYILNDLRSYTYFLMQHVFSYGVSEFICLSGFKIKFSQENKNCCSALWLACMYEYVRQLARTPRYI